MMLRLGALAVLTFTLATIQSARLGEALTFPTMDLSCFAWCTGDPSQNNRDLQPRPGRLLDGEGAVPATAACDDRAAPECASRESGDRWGNKQQQDEGYLDAM